MPCPQLFQQGNPNQAAVVTIVTFQAQYCNLVLSCQTTLGEEICSVIDEGEEDKIFLNNLDGMWFGGVNMKKLEHITLTNIQSEKSA
jgi:hypothetical protein